MATTTDAQTSATANNTDNASAKIIKIKSNDDQIFEIDQGVVEQSSTIKTLSDCKFIGFEFFIDLIHLFLFSNGCR
jgi:hypothetical protein